MPQGKGTYGKKVGRPPKKYQTGGEVDPFSLKNPQSIPSKVAMTETVEGQAEDGQFPPELETSENEIPTVNAQERSQTFQLGGAVQPPTAPSIQAPQATYKKGGKVKSKKVDVTDVVKDVENLQIYDRAYKELSEAPEGALMSAKSIFGRKAGLTRRDIKEKKKEILKGKKK